MGSGGQSGDGLSAALSPGDPSALPDRLSATVDGPATLLEREGELARIEALVSDIARAAGRAALIIGPAGIGKSTLCLRAAERARVAGVRVLQARGDELERAFSFGVARQLLAPLLAARNTERKRLLAGAARAAAPVLQEAAERGARTVSQTAPAPRDRSTQIILALHQLALNACALEPTLLVVDDCHWADRKSVV